MCRVILWRVGSVCRRAIDGSGQRTTFTANPCEARDLLMIPHDSASEGFPKHNDNTRLLGEASSNELRQEKGPDLAVHLVISSSEPLDPFRGLILCPEIEAHSHFSV